MACLYVSLAAGDWRMTGTVYRQPHASAAEVRELVQNVVGLPCVSFAGASLWVAKARLDPMTQIATAADLNLESDFGHAFSLRGEVRWKRVSRVLYDVLVLPAELLDRTDLNVIGSYVVRVVDKRVWMLLELPGGNANTRWHLGQVEYLGAGEEVWFTRYTQLEEYPNEPTRSR